MSLYVKQYVWLVVSVTVCQAVCMVSGSCRCVKRYVWLAVSVAVCQAVCMVSCFCRCMSNGMYG